MINKNMPTYIGFNTQDIGKEKPSLSDSISGGLDVNSNKKVVKKFRLTDEELVVRDFINALSIKQGEKVGNPIYGTEIWQYLFDPNTVELRSLIETEIRRIASLDPRLALNSLEVYSRDNGVLVELEVYVKPFDNIVQFGILLGNNGKATRSL
jgi:phage baseplate assembly protein W